MAGVYGFVPIVHIIAAVFSIIELGLTAYAAHFSNDLGFGRNSSPSQINFLVFASIWSLLVLLYVGLTPLYMARLFHKTVSVGLLVVTAIFWFAGAIALAVAIGGPYACGGNTFCGSVEASIAFAFFLWALFTFLAVLDTIEAMRTRGHATTTHSHTHPVA